MTSFHYTASNDRPQNKEMWAALKKSAGPDAVPDLATVGAWDGMDLIYQAIEELGPKFKGKDFIDYMRGKKLESARGPIMIDPEERDIIQNIFIREVQKVDGKLVNVDIATYPMIKDPWKEENPK